MIGKWKQMKRFFMPTRPCKHQKMYRKQNKRYSGRERAKNQVILNNKLRWDKKNYYKILGKYTFAIWNHSFSSKHLILWSAKLLKGTCDHTVVVGIKVYHAMLEDQLLDPGNRWSHWESRTSTLDIQSLISHSQIHVKRIDNFNEWSAQTVKGQALSFRSRFLHNPHSSVKSGHIQWMTSFHPTYYRTHAKVQGNKLEHFMLHKSK